MCSLFHQVDEQASDSNILATTCPVTVRDESLAEGSTSKWQSLFVPQEVSEESDESSSLDESHKRTKRRYLQKAQQCISAMLDVLAPENSQELWTELCDRHAASRESQDNCGRRQK